MWIGKETPNMNQKEVKKLKKMLIEKREDLLHIVHSKKEFDMQDAEIGDEIDSASQNSEKELLFELTDAEKQTLDAIETALAKLDKDKYGVCESCSAKIPLARLEAIPWVRYCISCQTKNERA